MKATLVGLAIKGLAILIPSANAQEVNHPAATLVVNGNAAGGFPLHAMMGKQDPGLVVLEGLPDAQYTLIIGIGQKGVVVPGLGTLHVQPDDAISHTFGVLDSNGRKEFLIPAGTFSAIPTGSSFTIQAVMSDPSTPRGFRLSGATRVRVVSALSSDIDLIPVSGSSVRMRGPVTSKDFQSISVGNLQYMINGNTEYGNGLVFDDIVVGDWAVIAGETIAPGGLLANEINIEDAEPMVRMTGRVQGIGLAGIAIQNRSVYMNTGTTYTDNAVQASYQGLELGMMVEVSIPIIGAVDFPQVASVSLNEPIENEPENEEEPEPEPELEVENEFPPPAPSFCS